ncbi:MAG: ABC transporter permease [Scytonema sp. PMC 1069.18]|nr:ABC transporter permease [Scytonema sp. PMC 1069.18]MEC4886030.1 ABC transporter permease [Scytonema sp. PMC 1070.18]
MNLNFLDKLGDWNPQFFRELKGRLKVFPAAIAVVSSLFVQLIVFLYQLREFPGEKYSMFGEYCTLGMTYEKLRVKLEQELAVQYGQLQELFRRYSSPDEYDPARLQQIKLQIAEVQNKQTHIYDHLNKQFCPLDKIDMQMWWRDHWGYIFTTLSVICIFTLLVAGTYLLINNLATEERRGTLNFIRLSPQPEVSVLIGKMLGVPILIYLVILAAVPFHFLSGHSSNIPTINIIYFWSVIIAGCIFFYSAALLFGLSCRWLSGFQPWLGSGSVLLFLLITIAFASSSSSYVVETAWLRMFSPFDLTNYLFPNSLNGYSSYNSLPLAKLQFFHWQVGKSTVGIVGLHLLNYSLCIYWIWQALTRCFRNPNITIISKSQSYLLMACLQIFNLGFYIGASQVNLTIYDIQNYAAWIYPLNLLVFLGLITILSPHRQTIQDWSRYRHQNISSGHSFRKISLWEDLMRGEKSPAILAIAINLVITATPFIVWILLWNSEQFSVTAKTKALLAVGLFISLIMIYATLSQLMLLMKNPKRGFLTVSTVIAVMFLPPMILGILGISAQKYSILWLPTTYSWVGIPGSAIAPITMTFFVQLIVLSLLVFQLIRQVNLAGESATKALIKSVNSQQ